MTVGLRVLATDTALRENGGMRLTLDYLARWRAHGARTVFAPMHELAADDPAPRIDPGPDLDVRPLIPAGRRFRAGAPRALARLTRLARQADVVFSGTEAGVVLHLTAAAAALARRPLVVFCQADLDQSLDFWVPRVLHRSNRAIIRHAAAAICVADSVVPGVRATGLPTDRVHVVRNGIDVDRVRAAAGDGATAGDTPTVLACGRLQAHKDFPTLLRAHAIARARGVDHRLVVLGDGPDRDALQALVAELGVEDSVELRGFDPAPLPHLAAADLFVLSSRTEGTPLVLLEALAVGVPIVSTRCGSGVEIPLDGGRLGRLVGVGDPEAMAAAIVDHLRDPVPLRAAAALAPDWVRRFDAEAAARAALAVLSRVTSGTAPGSAERPVRDAGRG